MKAVIITLALAGIASTATLDAQIVGNRLPLPTSNRTSVDGSWHAVGRDGIGTIYERRTRDGNGNIIVQRARRDANGNVSIFSTNTVRTNDNRNRDDRNRDDRDRDDRNRRNCDYNRTTNSIGDIIFGRTNDTYCDDVGNRDDGGWYQVGRGRDNNSIYERRTRDSNGNLIIQRARRNSNGTFSIFSTRRANDNDKQWRKAQKKQDKEWRKDQKREDKEWKKSGRGDNDDDDRSSFVRGDGRSYGSNSVAKGNGHGKGRGRGKH